MFFFWDVAPEKETGAKGVAGGKRGGLRGVTKGGIKRGSRGAPYSPKIGAKMATTRLD